MSEFSDSLHRRREDVYLKLHQLDNIAISVKSHVLLKQLLKENPELEEIMRNSRNEIEALVGIRNWVMQIVKKKTDTICYYKRDACRNNLFNKLDWQDYAAIRLLDYVDNAGKEYVDQNLRGEIAISNPIKMIWLAVAKGTGGAKPYFFEDMLFLFRQFRGTFRRSLPPKKMVEEWMERFPSGLDPRIIQLREENRERIIKTIIKRIDSGEIKSKRFSFPKKLSKEQKYLRALDWWKDPKFHLYFAIRSPDLLNEMLGYSLDPDTMKMLYSAEKTGIPFFVNPYYLSLLHVRVPYFAIGADLAIRDYIIYSQQLIDEFGHIIAWEKEDIVSPGKPNAAGWILPTHHNIHRRYPEVAILIPDTIGRACGGLCASCQRMYNFQNGHLNFNLDKLKPNETWSEKLERLMDYFENDSQLRDILITGGDALMSTNESLKRILEAIYRMAKRKKEANKKRTEKYAEILRIRLGTRIPVYLPQRINADLGKVLNEFKKKAKKIGICQFLIQTHFESPMEITPEAKSAIEILLKAGWTVTNQHVLTAASSRRGHRCKLRKDLNSIGVISYYTFSIKGYMENFRNFATNARAVQEHIEEKYIGTIPRKNENEISVLPLDSENMTKNIELIRQKFKIPFLSTDRNVLNLPGVGKSLTFRVIGITRYGRRILEFEHDSTRNHSPIINQMGKIVIIESKSISEYLQQLENIGEDPLEYESIWGYSIGETEPRFTIFEYPDYSFKLTDKMTNLDLDISKNTA